MSDYRRAYIPGGCFFFTVVTHHRQPLFAEGRNIDRLRDGFRRAMAKHPFRIDAIVILPDHLHSVWRLPEGDADFSLRWRLVKHYLAAGVPAATNRRGEKLVWQRRFWEHAIRDEEDWRNHIDYIHYNPVKHGPRETPRGLGLELVRKGGAARLVSAGMGGAESGESPGDGVGVRPACSF